jgi:hypothetical protein
MATPKCRRTTLHHPLPLSRWGNAANTSVVDLHATSHDIWHQLFENMTYEEAIFFVSIIMRRQQEGSTPPGAELARLRSRIMHSTDEEVILRRRSWDDPFSTRDGLIILTGLPSRKFHGPWLDLFGIPQRGGLSTVNQVARFIRLLMRQTKKVRRQDLIHLRRSVIRDSDACDLAG